MDLRQIDLNLLVVFNQLLVDRSVSLTADKLGLVTGAIREDFSSLQDFMGYFCGAPAMVEALNAVVQQRGMPIEKIHADAFYPSGT